MPQMKWSDLEAELPPEARERARRKTEAMLAEMEAAEAGPEWDEPLDGCGDGESEEPE